MAGPWKRVAPAGRVEQEETAWALHSCWTSLLLVSTVAGACGRAQGEPLAPLALCSRSRLSAPNHHSVLDPWPSKADWTNAAGEQPLRHTTKRYTRHSLGLSPLHSSRCTRLDATRLDCASHGVPKQCTRHQRAHRDAQP